MKEHRAHLIATVVLGVILLVLMSLNIAASNRLQESAAQITKLPARVFAEVVVFPGVTWNVSPASSGAYVGGHVHANGNGKFIITSATGSSIIPGAEWDAHGTDQGSIPQNISRPQGDVLDTGEIKANITIPQIDITQPIKVAGYLVVDSLAAFMNDKYTFSVGQQQAQSEEFYLYVYPSAERQTITNDATWAAVTGWIFFGGFLYLVVFFGPAVVWAVQSWLR
jgi:hypothetical protein